MHLGSARHVSTIDVQLGVRQLLSDGRPDVLAEPLDAVFVGRVLPVADRHEVCPAAGGLGVGVGRGEEWSAAELMLGYAVDRLQERKLQW